MENSKKMIPETIKELEQLTEQERSQRLVCRIAHPDAKDSYSIYDRETDTYSHSNRIPDMSSREKFKYGVEDFRDDSMKTPDAETFNKAINKFHKEHPESRLVEYATYIWFKGVNVVIHNGNLSKRTILPKKREKVLYVNGVGELKEARDIYS